MSIEITIISILGMIFCVIAQAFFSGIEMGMISVDKVRLRHEAAAGNKGAQIALTMLQKPEALLSTTLIGTNLSLVANSTIAAWLVTQWFHSGWSLLSVFALAPFVWIFGEIVPKSIFQQKSITLVPIVVYILWFFRIIFTPVIYITSSLAWLLRLGKKNDSNKHITLREEIRYLVENTGKTEDIKPQEQAMITRLFNFHETSAREVMVPLVDVISIENSANCRELLRLAHKAYHKIIPIHQERVDNIIGYVNTISALGQPSDLPISTLIQKISYIPGSKNIDELLVEMQHANHRLVTVVDEFGGAEGIITLEDIFEVVVDEVRDEYDAAEKNEEIIRKSEHEYELSARVTLDQIDEIIDYNLIDEETNITTISGLLLEEFGDIPKKGDTIRYKNIVFTILKARPQAIEKIRMQLPKSDKPTTIEKNEE